MTNTLEVYPRVYIGPPNRNRFEDRRKEALSYLAPRLTPRLRTALDTINIDRSFYFCYIPLSRLIWSTTSYHDFDIYTVYFVSIQIVRSSVCTYDFESVTVSDKVSSDEFSTVLFAKFVRDSAALRRRTQRGIP